MFRQPSHLQQLRHAILHVIHAYVQKMLNTPNLFSVWKNPLAIPCLMQIQPLENKPSASVMGHEDSNGLPDKHTTYMHATLHYGGTPKTQVNPTQVRKEIINLGLCEMFSRSMETYRGNR